MKHLNSAAEQEYRLGRECEERGMTAAGALDAFSLCFIMWNVAKIKGRL